MRVLYLDQSAQLGGGEIALLPWLCQTREEATVLLFEDGPFRSHLEDAGVPVHVVSLSGLKQVRRESGWRSVLGSVPTLLRTRSELRRLTNSFDLLYANSMKAFLVACLVRRRGQPVVWHLRDILSGDHFSTLLRRVAVSAANHFASAVIANSKATADAFVAAGGRASLTTVVYDGIAARKFDTCDADSVTSLRDALSRPGRLLLGVFSRLSHWKGQHVVLEAIRNLPNVDLLIVGDALFGEAAYAESLRSRAAEGEFAGRVNFLGFRSDIAELMLCVDIVIHSSTAAEPFGLVIVEGMLAGKPVIATCAGGAKEIIEQNRSGLLVTPASVDEMREAIVYLANHNQEARRLAATGRERAQQEFPLERMFAGLRQVIDGAAEAKGRAERKEHSRPKAAMCISDTDVAK